MKHIKTFKEINEEWIGTTLLILSALGIGYLVRKVRKFLSNFSGLLPMTKLVLFINKIEQLEKGEFDGEVIISEDEPREFSIIINKDGVVFDSITIDRYNDIVYNGTGTKRSKIIPFAIPKEQKEMEDDIRKGESELIEALVSIIKKYSIKK